MSAAWRIGICDGASKLGSARGRGRACAGLFVTSRLRERRQWVDVSTIVEARSAVKHSSIDRTACQTVSCLLPIPGQPQSDTLFRNRTVPNTVGISLILAIFAAMVRFCEEDFQVTLL